MALQQQDKQRPKWASLRISGIYLVVSALWIVFSDYLLYFLFGSRTAGELALLQTIKGWFFVAVTAGMLYLLIEHDFAAIRRSEQRREESEMGYKELANSISDIFFALDGDLRYVYWNRMVADFTGVSEQQAIGKHLYEIYPNIIGTDGEKELREALHGRRKRVFEHRYVLNGREYYFEISAYPAKDGLSVFVKDVTERVRTEKKLTDTIERIRSIFEDTVNVLANVAEKKDPFMAGHQQRVSRLAVDIARRMGLPGGQIEGIRVAGILHDIGKISVPAEILSKPGPLSENEFQIVKIYPRVSYEILREIKFPWPVAQIALEHQERMNGSGYPGGLRDGAILLEARILAVADLVVAATSHRPYRPARALDEVLAILDGARGTLYDDTVAKTCLELFAGGYALREPAAVV